MTANMDRQNIIESEARPHNTRLAQWGLTSIVDSLCFYCKFVLADNLLLQNPPLRQEWEH